MALVYRDSVRRCLSGRFRYGRPVPGSVQLANAGISSHRRSAPDRHQRRLVVAAPMSLPSYVARGDAGDALAGEPSAVADPGRRG